MTNAVILSERGPRRTLQPGGGESKDLRLHVLVLQQTPDASHQRTSANLALYQGMASAVPKSEKEEARALAPEGSSCPYRKLPILKCIKKFAFLPY
jgi:hypothetical protein